MAAVVMTLEDEEISLLFSQVDLPIADLRLSTSSVFLFIQMR
jgi:hypothetical protein